MEQQQQILTLMEKLFDAKLDPIAKDVAAIKQSVNGSNDTPGLIEEVRNIKRNFKLITTGIAFGLTLSLNLFFEFLKGKLKL